MNTRRLILLCFLFITGYGLPIMAATFDEDEYTLLDLQYQRQGLGNGVEAYFHKEILYVSLIDLISALELSIALSDNEAKGFISNPEDIFNLERKQSEWWVATKNKSEAVESEKIVTHGGYIYVDSDTIEDWFDLHFQLSYAELTLEFTTSKNLPVIERLRRQNRTIGPREYLSPAKNPVLNAPYELIELPSADLRSTTFIRDSQNSGTTSKSFYTLITHGDMAYMNTRLFLNGSQEDDVKNASIRMDRFDKTGNMAGPLKLSEISVGDLTHPSVPFAPGSNGRGVIIGNDSTSRQNSQDTTSIEGDYYPGQEVELYFGNSLIGYQVIPENGHYLFEDVLLFPGDNAFVLKFYGINGTVETEERNIRVGDTANGGNNFKYRLSLSEPDKTIIDIDDRNESKEDKKRASLTSRYTFNRYLSGSMGYVYNVEGDDASNFYNIGLQTRLFGNSFSVTATSEEDQFLGVVYSLGGYAFNTRYHLNTVLYGDPSDENNDPTIISNNRTRSYNLSLNSRFDTNSFTLKSKRNEQELGYDEEHRLGFSGGLWGTQWSSVNVYKTVESDLLENRFEDLTGGLFISRSIYPLSARLNLAYTLIPEKELTSAGLSFSFNPSSQSTLNFSANHNVISELTDYELSGSWKFDYLQITPRIRYDENSNTSAIVDFSTSIGKRTGRFGSYFNLDPKKRSNKGSVRARLYEDSNLNGNYDKGEDLLVGGKISATQYRSKGKSNEGGIAWIDHTKPWELTDIEYEANSLDEFSMRYSGEPFSVAARPGKVIEVDMPFTRTGDIDGTIKRLLPDGIKLPVRGAVIAAVNNSGKVIAENRSDLDGYFSLEGLLPGTYSITVRNEKIISRSLNKVIITSDGNFIGDYNLIVESKEILDPNAPINSKPLPKNKVDTPKTIKDKPNDSTSKLAPILNPQLTKTFPLEKPEPVTFNELEAPKVTPVETAKKEIATPFPNPAPAPITGFDIKESNVKTFEADQYAIKVGSYSNRSNAIVSIKRISELGHTTYTEIANTPKGLFTRVFIGPIKDRKEADEIKNTINKTLNEDTFLVPFKS